MNRSLFVLLLLTPALLAVAGCKKKTSQVTEIVVELNDYTQEAIITYDNIRIHLASSSSFDFKNLKTIRGKRRPESTSGALGIAPAGGLEEMAASPNESRGKNKQVASEVTIKGKKLEIVKGDLRIGSQSYGQVAANDKIVISSEGVKVNGQSRGALN